MSAIVNRSICFYKLRQEKCPEITYISVAPIRDMIARLNIEVSGLQKKLARHALPSFSPHEKRFREVEACRAAIDGFVQDIERTIRAIDISEPRMRISIQTYFFNILRKAIIFYRSVHQESLKRQDLLSECPAQETYYEDEKLLQMSISRASTIRQSIFSLTNTLLELKMALKAQSSMVDKIDFYFDESNFYLEQASGEIEKIPGSFSEWKNYIIYLLIYVVAVLLVIAGVKTRRK